MLYKQLEAVREIASVSSVEKNLTFGWQHCPKKIKR